MVDRRIHCWVNTSEQQEHLNSCSDLPRGCVVHKTRFQFDNGACSLGRVESSDGRERVWHASRLETAKRSDLACNRSTRVDPVWHITHMQKEIQALRGGCTVDLHLTNGRAEARRSNNPARLHDLAMDMQTL